MAYANGGEVSKISDDGAQKRRAAEKRGIDSQGTADAHIKRRVGGDKNYFNQRDSVPNWGGVVLYH